MQDREVSIPQWTATFVQDRKVSIPQKTAKVAQDRWIEKFLFHNRLQKFPQDIWIEKFLFHNRLQKSSIPAENSPLRILHQIAYKLSKP